jgi:hypothetical protein
MINACGYKFRKGHPLRCRRSRAELSLAQTPSVRPAGEDSTVQFSGSILKAVGMGWRRLASRDRAHAFFGRPAAVRLPWLRRMRVTTFIGDMMRECQRAGRQQECQKSGTHGSCQISLEENGSSMPACKDAAVDRTQRKSSTMA